MYIEETIHVYPVNDIEDHLLETTKPLKGEPYCECPCGARNEINDNVLMIIHNSFDGREAFEIDNPVRLN